MVLKIGENIRRLRRERGMTQEQLSGLLNVSCAAVSKWESHDTYPDITLLIPIARIFDVSLDELMDYDTARTDDEINRIFSEHWRLESEGKFVEASELIIAARKNYPNDFRIMNLYMWEISGGKADNNPEVLAAHYDELMQICDCLLESCTEESLRLDAMTMKAKLLHSSGKTPEALAILAQFPDWSQSAEQRTEQLYAKNTPEFRYWIRRNLYDLANFMANKLIKTIWYEENLSYEERVSRCEEAAELFAKLRAESDESVFAVCEHMAYAVLSGKLTFLGGKTEDIIRIRGKALDAARALTVAADKDEVLRERLMANYKTVDVTRWTVNWLETAPSEALARLRENREYCDMLEKYKT